MPHYQFIYNTADKSSIEIANIGGQGIGSSGTNEVREAMVAEPVAKSSAEITADREVMRLTLEE